MFTLSPSALAIFNECPNCFYLDRKLKIKRPRGIFPSLPGAVDTKLKTYYDAFRVANKKPPELELHPEMSQWELFSKLEELNKMRQWQTGLKVKTKNYELIGAIDELLFSRKSELYAPLDYKSKGKECEQADAEKWYQRQLDLYALMLESNGKKTSGTGYLVFYFPESCQAEPKTVVTNFSFRAQLVTIGVDIYRAKKLCEDAVECLSKPNPPASSTKCEYCQYNLFKTGVA